MAYEGVGNGYSGGAQPNYAQQLNEDQQQYGHSFDQYTNPFLNSRGVQGEVLPWLENARANAAQQQQKTYQQGILGIEQQRQNLAQTAQDTMLPLQANMLGAQASNIEAEGAARQFQLERQKNAYSQAPDFFSSLGKAVNNGDPAAALEAVGNNTDAAMAYPQYAQSALSYLDKNNTLTESVQNASAVQKAQAYVTQNPDATPDQLDGAWQDDPNSTPLQNRMARAAWNQGGSQKIQQAAAIQTQALNQQALATIRAGGTVDAASLRALGMGLKKGSVTIDDLERIAPGLGVAAFKGDGSFKPDPNAIPAAPSIYPDGVQKQVMEDFSKLPDGAPPGQKASMNALFTSVFPTAAKQMGVDKQVDPGVVNQLQSIQLQMKQPDSVIAQSQTNQKLMEKPTNWLGNPTGEPAPYDAAVQRKQALLQQQQQILKSIGQSPDSSTGIPSPQNTTGVPNQFNPQGVAQPPVVVPGNPATTQAIQKTAPATQLPKDAAPLPQGAQPFTKNGQPGVAFNGQFYPGRVIDSGGKTYFVKAGANTAGSP